jgi:hypothetical protein
MGDSMMQETPEHCQGFAPFETLGIEPVHRGWEDPLPGTRAPIRLARARSALVGLEELREAETVGAGLEALKCSGL